METVKQKRSFPFFPLILGILIGALAVGAFYFFQSKSNEKKNPVNESHGLLLSISSPSANQVVTEKTVEIKGTTGKNALVAVLGPTDQKVSATTNSSFSIKLDLTPGENQVTVYAVDDSSGESVQTTLSLLYLSTEMAGRSVIVAGETTTEPSDEEIDELRKKLATNSAQLQKQNVKFKNTHITGTILSISGDTLVLQTPRGAIQSVFTDDLTKYIAVGDTIGTINLPDLKVGNRVAVTGLSTEDTNGYSNYVIRLDKAAPSLQAVAGKLKERTDSSFSLTSLAKTDRTYTVNYNNDTKANDRNGKDIILADLETDDFVLAAGTLGKDGSVTAKILLVVPSSPSSTATPSAR